MKRKDAKLNLNPTAHFSAGNHVDQSSHSSGLNGTGEGQLDETVNQQTALDQIDNDSTDLSIEQDPDATADHAGRPFARVVTGRETKPESPSIPSEFIPGYRILGELGRGGMGVVFKARQLHADRTVALKVLLNVDRAGPEELARFQIEVQAAAKLQHPNIVQVYEVSTAGKLPYFTQEYLSGGTLSDKIQKQLLSHRETAECMLQLSQAIAYAHSKGVVHRDLKPSNILLAEDGTLKVADFGLARRMEDDSHLTRDGAILGTPSYMAPEQASGSIHQIGPSSDIYSLGAILYELLTGRPPFKGATVWEVINLVRTAEPASPSVIRPDTPRDLETICLKCLQKDPEKRYAGVAELAEDLRRHLNHEPILARPIGLAERFIRLCRRYPREASLVGVLSGVLLLFAVGATWAAIRLAHQRDQIATEMETSDQRLSLYKDTVSTFVNRTPQLLEGVPFSEGVRTELGLLVDELIGATSKQDAAVGPSQQWGLAGVAISRGDLLISQAEIIGREGGEAERVAQLLAAAENEYRRSEEISRSVLDSGDGDTAKGLGNVALSLSRLAVAKRLGQNYAAAEKLYHEAVDLRQQAMEEPDTEKAKGLRLAELGREYANLTELELLLAKQSADSREGEKLLAKATEHSQQAVEALRKALNEVSDGQQPSPNAMRDFVLATELAANLCIEKEELELADNYFSEGLAVARNIVEVDPLRLSHRVGLAKFAATYGDFYLVNCKDPDRAREFYVINMQQLRQIFGNEDLYNLQESGLAMGYYRLGLSSVGQGDPQRAKQYFERCELIRELDLRQKRDLAAARSNPDILFGPRIALMLTQARSGRWDLALEEARALVARTEDPEPIVVLSKADLLRHAAATMGIIAEQMDESERTDLLAEAVTTISKAIEAGFNDRKYLESDPDLLPLKRSTDFVQLVNSLD